MGNSRNETPRQRELARSYRSLPSCQHRHKADDRHVWESVLFKEMLCKCNPPMCRIHPILSIHLLVCASIARSLVKGDIQSWKIILPREPFPCWGQTTISTGTHQLAIILSTLFTDLYFKTSNKYALAFIVINLVKISQILSFFSPENQQDAPCQMIPKTTTPWLHAPGFLQSLTLAYITTQPLRQLNICTA